MGLGRGWGRFSHASPVTVSGITNATKINVGRYHACAVLSAGTAKCWGYNHDGELGNGDLGYSPLPVGVVGLR